MNDADEFARYNNAPTEPSRSDRIELLVVLRCGPPDQAALFQHYPLCLYHQRLAAVTRQDETRLWGLYSSLYPIPIVFWLLVPQMIAFHWFTLR